MTMSSPQRKEQLISDLLPGMPNWGASYSLRWLRNHYTHTTMRGQRKWAGLCLCSPTCFSVSRVRSGQGKSCFSYGGQQPSRGGGGQSSGALCKKEHKCRGGRWLCVVKKQYLSGQSTWQDARSEAGPVFLVVKWEQS